MRVVAIVVAGGVGSRIGGSEPKQLQVVGGVSILARSVAAMSAVAEQVVVVANADWLEEHSSAGADVVVAGGATRALSVRAGLAAAATFAPTHVLIHDAARPLVPTEVSRRVLDALAGGAAAVVPVVPLTDSLRYVRGGSVDRSQFRAVQTPQGFEYSLITRAHALRDDAAGSATDDASLVDALGVAVEQVEGDPKNIKVTMAADLVLAEILLG